jgi:hypothetical protein
MASSASVETVKFSLYNLSLEENCNMYIYYISDITNIHKGFSIIKVVLFIYELMHKWIVLKTILKFTLTL